MAAKMWGMCGRVEKRNIGKLLEMLVESVVMYGAEVWGCCRQLGEVEQVQLRAMRIFLGVGRLHPKVLILWKWRCYH